MVLLLVLQVIVSILLVGILMRLPEFSDPLYTPVWNLIILFLSQILGSVIIWLWIIPWLKLKYIRQSPHNHYAMISTLLLICLTWALIIVATIIIIISIKILQLETPRGGLEVLLIPKEILSPVTIIIFFVPLILGAPLFEELVYRRTLIPLLEERGMSPAGAVLASSLFFTLLHLPADLLNGNITGTIIHISSVLILAFVLGISYIKTRKLIYAMLIHGVVNGISAVPSILIEGTDLTTLYNIFYLFILVGVGLIYLLYLLWCNLKDLKAINIENIKSKTSINNIGFYGYLIISLGLLTMHTISLVFFQTITILIISPVLLLVLWIIIRNTAYPKERLSEYQIPQETAPR